MYTDRIISKEGSLIGQAEEVLADPLSEECDSIKTINERYEFEDTAILHIEEVKDLTEIERLVEEDALKSERKDNSI